MTHDVAGPSVASAGQGDQQDHGAAPAAKARTDADRDRTDKAATRPGEGTGDICERLRRWTRAVDAEPASDLMEEAADEIDRLRLAIRRLADQDATLSVCEGGVTVTMDATLTNEEREALQEAANAYADDDCNQECAMIAATLRGLLDRTK